MPRLILAAACGLVLGFPAAAQNPNSPPPAGMGIFQSEGEAQAHCPADVVVWLNTSSGTYHQKNDRWYAHTQRGAFVCKGEADKDGMKAAPPEGRG